MASIDAQSLNPVVEFASFASTEIVLFVMAAVVYGLFVHGPSLPSKRSKFGKVASPPGGDLKRAMEQFAEMKRLDLVDVVTYNTMLKAHLRRSQVVQAQDLLREMAARGLKASKVTYHELLNAMVNAGDQRGIWRLIDEMRKAEVPVSSITLSILLKSLTQRSSPADVQRTMGLLDALDEPMDEVLFSSAIEASIRVRQLGLLSDLIRRYRAREDSIALTSPTYGSMIKAFGQAGDTAQVHELWCDMEARGVIPTEITVGCMVDALVVNGQAEEACDLVHKLQDDSKKGCVNTVIYSTLLKGFAYSKKIEKVFAVYGEMQKQGIQCNTITYNTLLDACAKSCAMGRAPALLEDMRQTKAEPDLITYSTLIKGYCLEGSVDKAFRVLEDMKSDGTLRPDEIMYNSILDGCAKQQRVEQALSVLEEMQGAGVVPSNYTLSILVKLLGRTRRLSQAFTVVEDLSIRHGLHPNVQVYTCLMQACVMNKKLERALEVHDTMIAKGCAPDEKLYVSLVRGCLQLRAPRKACDVVRAAFQLPGGVLAASTGARGRMAGIDARTLEEVCEALRAGSPDDRAAAAALVADLEKIRGVRVGGRATPSKAGAAPWRR